MQLVETAWQKVLNQWTEYWVAYIYNYELHPHYLSHNYHTSLLQSNQTPIQEAESLTVQREEVEEAVRNLKAGKSPALDSSPSELLKNRGKATTTVLTACMPEDLGDEGMANGVGTITHCTLPKKGNFKQCQNYCIICLISHPSKTMVWVILNWLMAKAEELLAEEQTGFRPVS